MIVIVLSVIHFAVSAYFSIVILGGTPHIPDSVTYYRQGILLSQGKFFVSDFTREPIAAFKLLGSYVKDGNLYFDYNHFWPLMLALSIKLHFAQFLSPLLSAISLILVYLIATKLYDKKIGCISALFYCISPLSIIMTSDYMSHTATQLFLLAGIYFWLRYTENPGTWSAVCSGIFLGYAFGLRQLTAIGVAFPVVVYTLMFYRKQIFKFKGIFFIVGFLMVFCLFLADNYIITGSITGITNPIGRALSDVQPLFSFLNIPWGINMGDSTLAFLPPIIFYSFTPFLFFAFAFIPLIVYRKKEDFLLFSMFISLFVFYMFTFAMGNHGYGPRYLFEAVFALFILASRGVMWTYKQLRGAYRIVTVMIFVALIILNLVGLYTILPMYKDYNGLKSDVLVELKELDLANSIVIMGQEVHWQNDGITATLYDPNYEKSFFIKELPNNKHENILTNYPNKTVYKISDGQLFLYNWNKMNSS